MSVIKKPSEMNKELHVVYASDDRFAEILGVSLTSLYENNKEMDQVWVYILDSNISKVNKNKLEKINTAYGRSNIQWIQAKNICEELHMNVAVDRGSLSQYARLFVSSVLPSNIKRVLYLDCDVIIAQPLDELWNLNMQGKTIAALNDAFSKWYRMNIDLKPNDVMFNSGVMLIDLKRWKEQKVEERLMNFISSKNGKIQQGDQGALNAVLSHDVYCIEPKFNSVTIFYDFTYEEMLTYRKPTEYYSSDQIERAVKYPVIIHFTTSFLSLRPWMSGCQHKYKNTWLHFKNISPWKDCSLWEDDAKTIRKRKLINIYNAMPRNFLINFAGIFQAYIRPMLKRMNIMM